MNILGERIEALGLELQPKKTILVEFSKYGVWDRSINIRIRDTIITNKREAKFLGVWMDNKLDFHKQVQEIRGRVNKSNALMTYLNKKSRGMEVNTAFMLYFMLKA